jgi:hypothetical protein
MRGLFANVPSKKEGTDPSFFLPLLSTHSAALCVIHAKGNFYT